MKTHRLLAPAVAFAIAGAALADPPRLIISEAGVGPFRVGMTWTELQHAAPNITRTAVSDFPDCYVVEPRGWRGVDLLLERGRVVRVTVTSPSTIDTARGIRVGSPESAVRAAYAARVVRESSADADPGVHFLTAWTRPQRSGVRFVITTGRVKSIMGGTSAITLFEGCEP